VFLRQRLQWFTVATRDLREELDEILALRSSLDDQDSFLQAQDPNDAVPNAQISIVETLYDECREATTGVRMPFTRSDNALSLRPQIRYARGALELKITKLQREIEESSPPQLSPAPRAPEQPTSADPRKVFVVYGRNEAVNTALFHLLRAMDLEPIEWSAAIAMTGSGSPYPGDVLDVALSRGRAIVVFVTGDDMARLGTTFLKESDQPFERELTPQCRPNVLFEAGMAFGRHPERTIVVALGKTRPFTDTLGRHIIFLSNSADSRHELASRLLTAGCAVKIEHNKTWLTTGDFSDPGSPDAPTPPTDSGKTNHPSSTKIDAARAVSTYDPRLSISLKEPPPGGLNFRLGVIVTNVGGSEAHNITLSDVIASKHVITFPKNISVLNPGAATQLLPPNVTDLGPLQMRDMAAAMIEAWDHQPERFVKILRFPATATYDDFSGNHFRASWDYELHTFEYMSAMKRTGYGPDTHGPYLTVSAIKTERIPTIT
jgi:hypothetical protein